MTYVYFLSEYEEHGAEKAHATTNRDKVLSMILHYGTNKDLTLEIEALHTLLTQSDAELSKDREGHKLCGGWGGLMLHVVELE